MYLFNRKEKKSSKDNAQAINNDNNLFNKIKTETTSSKQETTFDSRDSFEEKNKELISNRSESYKKLLEDYVELSKDRNNSRENKKNDFYLLIKKILVISGIVFVLFLIRVLLMTPREIAEVLPVIISAFVAFLGEFISLPVIIANYLFNNSEDDNITKVILHTQEFDIDSQNNFNSYNKNNDKK